MYARCQPFKIIKSPILIHLILKWNSLFSRLNICRLLALLLIKLYPFKVVLYYIYNASLNMFMAENCIYYQRAI